jgi:hypothetical protein
MELNGIALITVLFLVAVVTIGVLMRPTPSDRVVINEDDDTLCPVCYSRVMLWKTDGVSRAYDVELLQRDGAWFARLHRCKPPLADYVPIFRSRTGDRLAVTEPSNN